MFEFFLLLFMLVVSSRKGGSCGIICVILMWGVCLGLSRGILILSEVMMKKWVVYFRLPVQSQILIHVFKTVQLLSCLVRVIDCLGVMEG